MSLVEVHPSESTRLKVRSHTSRKIASASRSSTTASVITTESIVAKDGASIPAPLAMPAKLDFPKLTRDVLGCESVVIIAEAQSKSESSLSFSRAFLMPLTTNSIGKCTPIIPVEQTPIDWALLFIARATSSADLETAASPSLPVQAFAPPLFNRTAFNFESWRAFWVHTTGAANI